MLESIIEPCKSGSMLALSLKSRLASSVPLKIDLRACPVGTGRYNKMECRLKLFTVLKKIIN